MLKKSDLEIIPIERAFTLPSEWYTNKNIYQLELDRIFTNTWQFAGSVHDIPKNGSYFPADAVNERIIVVRDDKGLIRAFYNVCKHRGGPIAIEAGCSKTLSCKYHGWTYRLDGSLRGVPKFDRAELFDKKDFGLVPVQVHVWENMIFVKTGDKHVDFNSFVEGITARIDPIKLSDFIFKRRVVYDVKCNWKVYVDNYLEGYHIPHVHPELCDLLSFQDYRTEIFKNHSLQFSPIRDKTSIYGEGDAFYYFVYPNFMMNILPDRLQTNVVIPVSEDATRVIFDYFYPKNILDSNPTQINADVQYSDKVQQEDIMICELVQKGLQSRAYHKGRYSVECEQGVYHFHSLLRKDLS